MDLKYSDDKEKDIIDNTKYFLSIFEKYIETYPFLYGDVFWLEEKFFKNFKKGEG